jgi:hypothetical protein
VRTVRATRTPWPRSRRLLVAAGCLVAALAPAGAEAGRSGPTRTAVNGMTFLDAPDDSGSALDINTIRVENDDDGEIVIQVRFRVPREPLGTDFVAMFIDSDQNATTGSSTGSEWSVAALGPQQPGGVGTFRLCRTAPTVDCAVPQGSFAATFDAEAATFTVARTDLGVSRGFDFWVGTSGARTDDPAQSDYDFAPEGGEQFRYDVVISPPCVVPNVRGRTLAASRRALTRANCKVGTVTRRASATVPEGRVIASTPRAGTRLPNRTSVNLFVSSGRR